MEFQKFSFRQIGHDATMHDQSREFPSRQPGSSEKGAQNQSWPAAPTLSPLPTAPATDVLTAAATAGSAAAREAERVRLRQGVMHVRLRHFYCTLEERADPGLRGQPFVIGTGTGRPNEPGRVIDVSPAAQRLGISPGMPLRRAYRLAPRARFLPSAPERYQPV